MADYERNEGFETPGWSHVITTQPLAVQIIGGVIATALGVLIFGIDKLLITAVLALAIGLILLARIRRTSRGRYFAMPVVLVVVGAALIGGSAERWLSNRSIAQHAARPVLVAPNVLQKGDCFNAPDVYTGGDLPANVYLVRCTETHDVETFFAGDNWPTTRLYPGETEEVSEADKRCGDEFLKYVGVTEKDSVLDYAFYRPSYKSWQDDGRRIECVAYNPRKALNSSVKGLHR